jgi:hypothetical protein
MSPHRLAYISLIAAVVALRLACAGAPVSASDRRASAEGPANPSAAEAGLGAQEPDPAPLITGRSVALRTGQIHDATAAAERRLHDGLGAAGFARR